MKKKWFMILAVAFMMISTGCEKEEIELGDTYVEGQDYQYMLEKMGDFVQKQARGEEGYFFLHDNFVYYLDDATMSLTPLCNKVDCLHDKETVEEKYVECNAYVNTTFDTSTGIGYCDEYLYAFEGGMENDSLYRLKEDGSQKEVVYEWKDSQVNDWIIHRGYMFYVDQTFETEEGSKEAKEVYCVKKLALDGIGNSPETIYESSERKTALTLECLMAYGNYVYFQNMGSTTSDIELVQGENWLDYTYMTNTIYNISTGELSELKVPNQSEHALIQDMTFWQDKVIMHVYDFEKEEGYLALHEIYMADLDGSNAEVIFEDVPQATRVLSDGKYLYLSNAPMVMRGYEEVQQYKVYNTDLELVDTLGMPFSTAGDFAIGMEEGVYILSKTEIFYFDKSTIGTYNGEAFEITSIADLP